MNGKKVRFYLIAVLVPVLVIGLLLVVTKKDESGTASGVDAGEKGGSGIGSEAALAAPDCDRPSGRLAISYVYRPPCAVPWTEGADNSGETSPGVTATSIKVVHYSAQTVSDSGAAELKRKFQTSIDAFQHFYRGWGRKVEVSVFNPSGTDDVAQRADAIAIANQRPFAVTGVTGRSPVMATELAHRKILALQISPGVELAEKLAPYVWGVGQSGDRAVQMNVAEYVGRSLHGKPARFAGDPAYHTTERKFALVHPDSWNLDTFNKGLEKHGGGKIALTISYNSGDQAAFTERSRVMAARLKEAGVTSVIAATDFAFTSSLTAGATSQQYRPEWVLTGFGAQDVAVFARTYDQTQWAHAFGLGALPLGGVARDPNTPLPEFWFYRWYWGNTDMIDGDFHSYMTLLFTGIHGAGPRLTPKTFRAGAFALPPSGGAAAGAVMSAQVSYGKRAGLPWTDYNGSEDFSEIYWDATAKAVDVRSGLPAVGHYRHLSGGRRFTVGDLPADEPTFFDSAGTVISFPSYQPNDMPPNFPCNGCPSQR